MPKRQSEYRVQVKVDPGFGWQDSAEHEAYPSLDAAICAAKASGPECSPYRIIKVCCVLSGEVPAAVRWTQERGSADSQAS